jgi:hypothetical protein
MTTIEELRDLVADMTKTVREYRQAGVSPGEGSEREEVRRQEAQLTEIFANWDTADILFLLVGLLTVCGHRKGDEAHVAIFLNALIAKVSSGALIVSVTTYERPAQN